MSAAPRRFSGRIVVPLVLGLIGLAVAAGMAVWYFNRFPNGAIVALVPVDEARVLVLRRGYESRGYYHLTMEGEGAARHWSATLFGLQDGAVPVASPALATIQAREARGNVSTHAYAIEDGSFAFRAGRLGPEVAYDARGETRVVGDTRYTVAWGESAEIHAIDAEGRDLLSIGAIPVADGPRRFGVARDVILLDVGDGRVRILDRETGDVRDRVAGSFCVAGDEAFLSSGPRLTVVGDPDRRGYPPLLAPVMPPLWACGRTGEGHVIVFGDPSVAPAEVVGVDGGPYGTRFHARVQGGEGRIGVLPPPPGRPDLPAHLWLPDGPTTLVAIDLARGAVVGRYDWSEAGEGEARLHLLQGETLLRVGEQLVVLGGDGRVGAAARVVGLGGVAQRPEGGRLWVWAGDAFVALDPATLEVEVGGSGVVDVRPIEPPVHAE